MPENHRLAESVNPFKTSTSTAFIYCVSSGLLFYALFVELFYSVSVSPYGVSDQVVCILFSYYILIQHIYSILILINIFIFRFTCIILFYKYVFINLIINFYFGVLLNTPQHCFKVKFSKVLSLLFVYFLIVYFGFCEALCNFILKSAVQIKILKVIMQ